MSITLEGAAVASGGGGNVPPHVWRIHGRDYDLKSFVQDHPGGPMILLGKGSDCTILFETYHALNEPRKRLRTHDVTADGLSPPEARATAWGVAAVRASSRASRAARTARASRDA